MKTWESRVFASASTKLTLFLSTLGVEGVK
jgi:hypothetical protein